MLSVTMLLRRLNLHSMDPPPLGALEERDNVGNKLLKIKSYINSATTLFLDAYFPNLFLLVRFLAQDPHSASGET